MLEHLVEDRSHLHYEVKHKNRTINPMKLRLQSTSMLKTTTCQFLRSISLLREVSGNTIPVGSSMMIEFSSLIID